MKRDDDQIRQFLMELEEADGWEFLFVRTMGMTPEDDKRLYHVLLLEDQGLVVSKSEAVYRLTAQGHDYLEAIRDEGIWAKTKAIVAEEGGNATFAIVNQIAAALLKKKFTDLTGLQL